MKTPYRVDMEWRMEEKIGSKYIEEDVDSDDYSLTTHCTALAK